MFSQVDSISLAQDQQGQSGYNSKKILIGLTKFDQTGCLDYAGRYFSTLRVLQATNEQVNIAAYGMFPAPSFLLNK